MLKRKINYKAQRSHVSGVDYSSRKYQRLSVYGSNNKTPSRSLGGNQQHVVVSDVAPQSVVMTEDQLSSIMKYASGTSEQKNVNSQADNRDSMKYLKPSQPSFNQQIQYQQQQQQQPYQQELHAISAPNQKAKSYQMDSTSSFQQRKLKRQNSPLQRDYRSTSMLQTESDQKNLRAIQFQRQKQQFQQKQKKFSKESLHDKNSQQQQQQPQKRVSLFQASQDSNIHTKVTNNMMSKAFAGQKFSERTKYFLKDEIQNDMQQTYSLANDFNSRSFNVGIMDRRDSDSDGLLDENLLSSMRDIAHNISKVADDEIDIYFKSILEESKRKSSQGRGNNKRSISPNVSQYNNNNNKSVELMERPNMNTKAYQSYSPNKKPLPHFSPIRGKNDLRLNNSTIQDRLFESKSSVSFEKNAGYATARSQFQDRPKINPQRKSKSPRFGGSQYKSQGLTSFASPAYLNQPVHQRLYDSQTLYNQRLEGKKLLRYREQTAEMQEKPVITKQAERISKEISYKPIYNERRLTVVLDQKNNKIEKMRNQLQKQQSQQEDDIDQMMRRKSVHANALKESKHISQKDWDSKVEQMMKKHNDIQKKFKDKDQENWRQHSYTPELSKMTKKWCEKTRDKKLNIAERLIHAGDKKQQKVQKLANEMTPNFKPNLNPNSMKIVDEKLKDLYEVESLSPEKQYASQMSRKYSLAGSQRILQGVPLISSDFKNPIKQFQIKEQSMSEEMSDVESKQKWNPDIDDPQNTGSSKNNKPSSVNSSLEIINKFKGILE